ncbi:pentatricopeptide repeat-containing protein [Aspergillus clavatus NRRL 1]|uniref:Pentatricopeptide repeat protein n=1 Tax=Aspergillus clavatus (strain ATCC 1007 / CBS 513.65 / DSM 816 / NCTC 3887 / NRRL 1 / QM 1276 / 107) TaxID=344612 RepID=A1C6C6_ASPCL|nr:pentatricopeptide repeat protein [Aspergillus clavatus NRRL 1]EAW13947.1 pentatricopeptide repeat protein [Aspergillus clavatus NRRL 1]
MLRCSNAAALRTGVEYTMSLRRLTSSRWTKSAPGMFYATPLARAAQRGLVGRQLPSWRSIAVKQYSTETSVSDPTAEVGVTTTETSPADVAEPQKEVRKKRRDDGGGSLLDLAMGTSSTAHGEDPEAMGATISRKVVEMELKWLKDPKVLADRVARVLQAGDAPLAVALIRKAQMEKMECTVAWNHLFEYCLKQGEPKAAFKFWNEMKKRGRKPNSWAYTIMLNGLSTSKKSQGFNPVKTALSIYRSIYASNSAVKPSIIHTNAMLNVCSRHGDMDTLWEVAGELPEDGPGSPDPLTYTVILRAIQNAAQRDVEKLGPSDVQQILARKAQAVKEGKRIWSDVVYRWRKGQIALDNKLVGGMASLLLEGATQRDCYDIFALMNQAFGIPNLASKPPPEAQHTSARPGQWNTSSETKNLEDVPFVDADNRVYRPTETETEPAKEEQEEDEDENFENLFDPVIPVSPGFAPKTHLITTGGPGPQFITAGNKELCTILEACLTMTQGLGLAKNYWQYLTEEGNEHIIHADMGSIHAYLRILRLARSSRLATDLIRYMPNPQPKTFHIALSCCRRDRRNMNALKYANELLDIMSKTLVLPHPKALEDYLDFVQVLLDNPQHLMALNGLKVKRNPMDPLATLGRKLRLGLLSFAVQNLQPHITKLKEAMEHGRISRNSSLDRPRDQTEQSISGSLALKVLVRTRGLIDELLKSENTPLLNKYDCQQWKREATALRKFSDTEMVNKFRNTLVHPTPAQLTAFEEKRDIPVDTQKWVK